MGRIEVVLPVDWLRRRILCGKRNSKRPRNSNQNQQEKNRVSFLHDFRLPVRISHRQNPCSRHGGQLPVEPSYSLIG